jgi:hypothetical protein
MDLELVQQSAEVARSAHEALSPSAPWLDVLKRIAPFAAIYLWGKHVRHLRRDTRAQSASKHHGARRV